MMSVKEHIDTRATSKKASVVNFCGPEPRVSPNGNESRCGGRLLHAKRPESCSMNPLPGDLVRCSSWIAALATSHENFKKHLDNIKIEYATADCTWKRLRR